MKGLTFRDHEAEVQKVEVTSLGKECRQAQLVPFTCLRWGREKLLRQEEKVTVQPHTGKHC